MNIEDFEDDEYACYSTSDTTTDTSSLDKFYDLGISHSERAEIVKSLEKNVVMDAVNNLCVSYTENLTSAIHDVLVHLIKNTELHFPLRLRCCETLLYNNDRDIVRDQYSNTRIVETTRKMKRQYIPMLIELLYSVVYYNKQQQAEFDVSFALIFEWTCKAFQHSLEYKNKSNENNESNESDEKYDTKQKKASRRTEGIKNKLSKSVVVAEDFDSSVLERGSEVSETEIEKMLKDTIKTTVKPKQPVIKADVEVIENVVTQQQAQGNVTIKDLVEKQQQEFQIGDEVQTQVIDILQECVSNCSLDEKYRYRLLKNLYNLPIQDTPVPRCDNHTFTKVAEAYFRSELKVIVHSIFVIQMLKNRSTLNSSLIETFLERTKTYDLTYNEKADVADLLLGIPETEEVGREMLAQLGESNLLYSNKQNVHQIGFELEKFITLISESKQTFQKDEIIKDITMKIQTNSSLDKVSILSSLSRIELDSELYSSKKLTLFEILCLLYNWIQHQNSIQLLTTRLLEELSEMSDTCSTGHLVRMSNVLSGICEGFLSLSVADEIKSVVHYRLKKYISSLDEDAQECVMDDLLDGTEDEVQRLMFKQISELHTELQKDYAKIATEQQFTDAFRDSVTSFFAE
jgi:hypothetical protein